MRDWDEVDCTAEWRSHSPLPVIYNCMCVCLIYKAFWVPICLHLIFHNVWHTALKGSLRFQLNFFLCLVYLKYYLLVPLCYDQGISPCWGLFFLRIYGVFSIKDQDIIIFCRHSVDSYIYLIYMTHHWLVQMG